MPINIAVLLTCFNRKEKTLACLGRLFSLKNQQVQLVVYLVDDGSTDGTGDAVRFNYPEVNLIQGTGELYWNRGMHLAWSHAAKDGMFNYYMLLNDDSFLLPGAIKELLSCAEQTKNNAVICGSFKSAVHNGYTYGGRTKDGKAVIPNGTIQPCFSINGNCLLVPKQVFDSVGNLDPIFPHAIGDFDYGQRALARGFSLVVTTKYIGTCETNPKLPKWCYPQVAFKERVKALYSPLGNSHPKYYFIYIQRHFGLFLAVKQFLSIHLRLCFPQLWKH